MSEHVPHHAIILWQYRLSIYIFSLVHHQLRFVFCLRPLRWSAPDESLSSPRRSHSVSTDPHTPCMLLSSSPPPLLIINSFPAKKSTWSEDYSLHAATFYDPWYKPSNSPVSLRQIRHVMLDQAYEVRFGSHQGSDQAIEDKSPSLDEPLCRDLMLPQFSLKHTKF